MCTNKGGGGRGGSGGIPAVIQSKVDKVRQMTKKSSYGKLQGDIKVTKDRNGNYNLSYTQVINYDTIKSNTIGVGDIPARKETTYTTHVLDKNGKRINTIRKTEKNYKDEPSKATTNDWTGTNANRGISRTAKRRMKNAMEWAKRR